MPPKRRDAHWDDLAAKMRQKRTRCDAMGRGKPGAAPHELVVQRLAAEPDNKQTFRPVQPREFVSFEFSELNLANLKKACASHFNLPSSTCDVLVTNKGPSATNINQIPHQKNKVYLVRFTVDGHDQLDSDVDSTSIKSQEYMPESTSNFQHTTDLHPPYAETNFPESVSISALLQAGMLKRPVPKTRASLLLEEFNIKAGEWNEVKTVHVMVDSEKFSSGGFRDAFHASSCSPDNQKWVIKRYNPTTKEAFATLKTTVEDHTRKQVQMHSAARQLTKHFASVVPDQFGKCFFYNRAFYTTYQDEPATIEEFVPGKFVKFLNNNGVSAMSLHDCNPEYKEMLLKAECLVHFTYEHTNHKLMLLDIQGSQYQLYDPEIATSDLTDNSSEFFFCCGNLSSVAISQFLGNHCCNKFCKMLRLQTSSAAQ